MFARRQPSDRSSAIASTTLQLARPAFDFPTDIEEERIGSRNMSAFFFSTPVDIDIVLEDGDDRQMVDMKTEKGRREKAPLYKDGESVKGAVTIRPKDGKRLEHTGIKVQFIGTIGRKMRHAWGRMPS